MRALQLQHNCCSFVKNIVSWKGTVARLWIYLLLWLQKGRAVTELGVKRLFMVGSGRLFEKLTALDDNKNKMWAYTWPSDHVEHVNRWSTGHFVSEISYLGKDFLPVRRTSSNRQHFELRPDIKKTVFLAMKSAPYTVSVLSSNLSTYQDSDLAFEMYSLLQSSCDWFVWTYD